VTHSAVSSHLWSIVDTVDRLESKIKPLEDAITRISVQTPECGIFIKQLRVPRTHGVLDHSSVVVVVDVSFISRFRLRPLKGTRQERPGMYLSRYLV